LFFCSIEIDSSKRKIKTMGLDIYGFIIVLAVVLHFMYKPSNARMEAAEEN
jgi:hypothetical protein